MIPDNDIPSPTTSNNSALELDGVTKRFGDFVAVDALSMRVEKGSIYGFLGPNGSGKTTTMRMVMSILYPDEGSLSILGHGNAEQIKDRLGYLPEEKGLYKKMRVGEIVAYFGTLKGLSRADARRRAQDLLEQYGLGEWIDKKCEAMSKGMGQKVQLLGTLIHDPDLLILDEPFSGLDPINMELMRDTILQMKREGRTVLFSTHVMHQAEEICDSILLIHKGKKVLDGPLAEIKSSGSKAIRLDYDGDGAFLARIEGVERVNDSGKSAEIVLSDGRDPQELLENLVGRLVIRRFDLREPSLHEIYVRTVGEAAGVEEPVHGI
ncbi:MAG: ABC transporter ATP-binding protein [Planctomycetota bacterium]